MTPEEITRRAVAADAVLGNEKVQSSFDEIKAGLIRQWENTAPGQAELREQIWAQVNAINALRGSLRVDIDNAKMAAASTERQQKRESAQ